MGSIKSAVTVKAGTETDRTNASRQKYGFTLNFSQMYV